MIKIRNYFPQQNPFEIENDILHYVGYQLNLSVELINPYQAQCFLKEQSILQPALSTLGRIVGTYRDLASNDIESRLTRDLSAQAKENLKDLLIVNEKRSILWKLKRPPGLPSVNGMKTLTT